MNKREIKDRLSSAFYKWTNSIENKDLRKKVEEDCFIAGGAISSLLLNEQINDIDIYFTSKDVAKELMKYYIKYIANNSDSEFQLQIDDKDEYLSFCIPDSLGILNIDNNRNEDDDYVPLCISKNAMTLSNKVQIIFRFIDDPWKICDNFDFIHTRNYYKPDSNNLILNSESLEYIINKELFYTSSKYPIASLFRMKKFITRGWKINAGQMMKIVFDINELNLKNTDIVKEQLIGVDMLYFREILNKIKNKEEIDKTFFIQKIDEVFNGE
ncbi:MAG: hypothetical protein ACOCP8_05725 [archaeon]